MTHVFGPQEIELANGQPFSPAHPDHRAVDLETVAYALAGVRRYGGHSRPRISVASHAVFVSRKLERLGLTPSVCLAGLHHDDPEGLNGLGDPQRPAKGLLDAAFKEREKKLDRCVWRALAWPDKDGPILWTTDQLRLPLVKAVDTWACAFEAKRCMRSKGAGWDATFGEHLHDLPAHRSDAWWFWFGQVCSKWQFIVRHRRLARRVSA